MTTFDEWWDLHTYADLVRSVMQTAWDEAIKQERERCARFLEISNENREIGKHFARLLRMHDQAVPHDTVE